MSVLNAGEKIKCLNNASTRLLNKQHYSRHRVIKINVKPIIIIYFPLDKCWFPHLLQAMFLLSKMFPRCFPLISWCHSRWMHNSDSTFISCQLLNHFFNLQHSWCYFMMSVTVLSCQQMNPGDCEEKIILFFLSMTSYNTVIIARC